MCCVSSTFLIHNSHTLVRKTRKHIEKYSSNNTTPLCLPLYKATVSSCLMGAKVFTLLPYKECPSFLSFLLKQKSVQTVPFPLFYTENSGPVQFTHCMINRSCSFIGWPESLMFLDGSRRVLRTKDTSRKWWQMVNNIRLVSHGLAFSRKAKWQRLRTGGGKCRRWGQEHQEWCWIYAEQPVKTAESQIHEHCED